MTEAEWPSEIEVACDTLANIIKVALDKYSVPKVKLKIWISSYPGRLVN